MECNSKLTAAKNRQALVSAIRESQQAARGSKFLSSNAGTAQLLLRRGRATDEAIWADFDFSARLPVENGLPIPGRCCGRLFQCD
ncbi:MAG: hypothetical protein CML24_06150 [Rhizobiales bacterium]|nr:hypothetical protein [Hyphomicrobiales bacterium]